MKSGVQALSSSGRVSVDSTPDIHPIDSAVNEYTRHLLNGIMERLAAAHLGDARKY